MGMPGMMGGMPGMMGMGGGLGGNFGGGGGGGGLVGANLGAMMMSEADYIALCEDHVRKLGMQVSREQIKAHYSQIKAQFMGR
jgi:hypothetical protein